MDSILSTGNILPTISRYGIAPLTRFVRISYGLFLGTIGCQILNTALRYDHRNSIGYWFYILLLEGPVMIFNLFMIYTFQQWIALTGSFPFVRPEQEENGGGEGSTATTGLPTPTTILWSYGSLTMPAVESIQHDVQLAATVPIASFGLCIFWVLAYMLFEDDDGQMFDDTFWDGVDMKEMSTFDGVIDNVAAQAFWRCLTLLIMSLILPAYPMSGCSFWVAGLMKCFPKWNTNRIAYVTDVIGSIMSCVLLLVGIYETIWDDDNGVGIWHFFNSSILLMITIPRILLSINSDASNHVLLSRPCYQEKEATTTTDTTTTTIMDIAALPASPSPIVKEQELPETSMITTNTATGTTPSGDDNGVVDPTTSEIV